MKSRHTLTHPVHHWLSQFFICSINCACAALTALVAVPYRQTLLGGEVIVSFQQWFKKKKTEIERGVTQFSDDAYFNWTNLSSPRQTQSDASLHLSLANAPIHLKHIHSSSFSSLQFKFIKTLICNICSFNAFLTVNFQSIFFFFVLCLQGHS